jgi:hypothetical protein
MIYIQIRCNRCDVIGRCSSIHHFLSFKEKAHVLRKQLKIAGWKYTECGGVDLCVKCRKEIKDDPSPRN